MNSFFLTWEFILFQYHVWSSVGHFKIDFYVTLMALIVSIILFIGYSIQSKKFKNSTIFDSRFFKLLLILTMILLLTSAFSYYLDENPLYLNIFKTLVIFNFSIVIVQFSLFNFYFFYKLKDVIKFSKISINISYFLVFLAILFYFYSLFSGNCFFVDDRGILQKGKFYLLTKSVGPIVLSVDLLIILINHKKLHKTLLFGWSIYIILPILSLPLSLKFSPVFLYLSFFLSLLIIYITINVIENQYFIEKENQNIKLRFDENKAHTEIVLTQLQPHFLFNTLASISALCDLDPDKAQEATVKFSQYLRTNINTIKEDNLISFSEEIEHIKNYLWIERIRFEDKLQVQFKIETQDFYIPSLSIQPLVENAVRHGICQKQEGGVIQIETIDLEDEILIMIIDNGYGFDDTKDVNNNQIGINNCNERIKTLLNGYIEVVTKIYEGTTVTVHIPKKVN